MRLYHITSDHSKFLMTEGIGKIIEKSALLTPRLNTPQSVMNNRSVFNGGEHRWYVNQERIHCMENPDDWLKTNELNRLIYLIKSRAFSSGSGRIAFCSFETLDSDKIFVCEADWLRKYHDGDLNHLEAHLQFAESKKDIQDYHNNFTLPEYLVLNPIPQERIKWLDVPKEFTPLELKTKVKNPDYVKRLEF